MNILIIYMSSHGCTQKVALIIADKLKEYSVTVHNLKDGMLPHLHSFDLIIIGGSIHVGKIQAKMSSYCDKNESVLVQKKLGLYLCCMEKGDTATKQFNEAFSPQLREKAVAEAIMGGEFNFDRMSFFEKAIVKKIAHINSSVSEIKYNAIDDFVKTIKKQISSDNE